MRILVLGSTLLTQRVTDRLARTHEILGHVPSKKPTIPGDMSRWREVEDAEDADLILSIQYDRKWHRLMNAWNCHTGLLPSWGGTDILWHTIQEGATEQGLTFHKMTESLDEGGILSTFTYPVQEQDTVLSLYRRLLVVAPPFVEASVALLDTGVIHECLPTDEPFMYRRGEVEDPEGYRKAGEELRRAFQ